MSASPTWDASQERLVFLSLHDVKVAITAEIFRSSEELEKVITNTVSSSSSAFQRESLSAFCFANRLPLCDGGANFR
jgi:hypothetical protein